MTKELVAPKEVVLESLLLACMMTSLWPHKCSPPQLTYPCLLTLAPHGTPRPHAISEELHRNEEEWLEAQVSPVTSSLSPLRECHQSTGLP